MTGDKADGKLFTKLFNQLDVHDQITVLRYMDDLSQEQERREKAILNIQDFMDHGKEPKT